MVNEKAVHRAAEIIQKRAGSGRLSFVLSNSSVLADQDGECEKNQKKSAEIKDEKLDAELKIGHQIEVALVFLNKQMSEHHLEEKRTK